MFTINDIYDEGKRIVGACDDQKFFKWCGDVVSMVSNKADLESWKLQLDICTAGCSCSSGDACNRGANCGRRCLTLPREVETVIAVNIGGQPTLGFGQLYEFHLNGPGSCKNACDWSWVDQGQWHFTYKDLVTPAKLVVYLQTEEDNGKYFIVYGYDDKGNVLRRNVGGEWLNGILIPTVYGYAIPSTDQPTIARITGILKESSVGSMRLATIDNGSGSGVNLGVYEPDETSPQYRRILLNRACSWVRVACIKTNPIFHSRFDHIPLKSRIAFLLGLQARKHYSALQIGDAHAYEADAARLELEAQQKAEPPTYSPIMVIDRNNLRSKDDYDIR